ncbi:phosphodiester glycosidase family protein [Aneurinibacillus sp. Ricciae_BoGa-3]|uniref:phosphodiester glycosidase family protein n=1 Tax=Aneurinibacillus sp. Ricciae_BoGa-3 TaxID=3022697 RepID=UPI0023423FAD|nr:phosphodiester glycosidase family protein [Aneurinibacillus sp. Ricciae_BoGa-3]WCK55546.1 phosphodiester glycosidase family protein [Aneurinibacillus sp. Ricciae_BoGa-3]
MYKPPIKQPIQREPETTKKRVPRKKPKKKFRRRVFSLFLGLCYIYISTALIVFKGPYQNVKDYALQSLGTTQHPKLWISLFSLNSVSAAEIAKYAAGSGQPLVNSSGNAASLGNFGAIKDNSIQIDDYKDNTFSAKIMLVRDPKRIKVGVTNQIGKVGQTVSEMVRDNNAVAGVNGGSFQDVGWHGTGGIPLGTTIHDGNYYATSENSNVIGITANGSLISGKYSAQELQNMGVNEALSFGPILVKDGQGLVRGNGGWGNAPRTAIGQKADGTIIFIVTDGRFVHGPQNLGATLHDIQDLMLKYGAVTAVNLDGGSSATMVYNGKLVNEPSDVLGERKVATSFIVMPE